MSIQTEFIPADLENLIESIEVQSIHISSIKAFISLPFKCNQGSLR